MEQPHKHRITFNEINFSQKTAARPSPSSRAEKLGAGDCLQPSFLFPAKATLLTQVKRTTDFKLKRGQFETPRGCKQSPFNDNQNSWRSTVQPTFLWAVCGDAGPECKQPAVALGLPAKGGSLWGQCQAEGAAGPRAPSPGSPEPHKGTTPFQPLPSCSLWGSSRNTLIRNTRMRRWKTSLGRLSGICFSLPFK